MSAVFNLRCTRKNTRQVGRNHRLSGLGHVKWKLRRGRQIDRLLPHREGRRRHPSTIILGRTRGRYNMQSREFERRMRAWRAGLSENCKSGNHDFNNDDYCAECGTSLWGWAFLEMP